MGVSISVRTRRNGASIALTILCPGRTLLGQTMSLCLMGRAALQGPTPGGGYYPRVLCGAALRLDLSASKPRSSPGRNIHALLENNVILEGGEYVWGGVP